MSSRAICLDNDLELEYPLTRKNATTGAEEVATGLTGLVGRISATPGGATIHAELSVSLTERGTTGVYYGILDGDKLRSRLATYVGLTVYRVMGDGVNVLRSTACKVFASCGPDS